MPLEGGGTLNPAFSRFDSGHRCQVKILRHQEIVMGHKEKRAEQLGMNPSTAQHRLKKDLLYKYVALAGDAVCYRCGEWIEIDDFSVEHKEAWLDSEDPLGLFFDLANIGFSHSKCNSAAARPSKIAQCGSVTKFNKGCKCELCVEAKRVARKKYYSAEKRRLRYEKTGN